MKAAVRQNFIDWMKAIGMFLIVTGHVVGDPYAAFNQISQPAYTKQLGVAFFVFIAGWGLANVKQPSLFTVYKRLFAIFAYGIFFALFFSALFFFINGQLQLSNYSPFVLGANVLFNNFPANPTTWYIGTYLHIVLLWFFLTRKLEITPAVLIIAFILENVVRICLLSIDLNFVAYMLFPNWLSVFLLGHYFRKVTDKQSMGMAIVFAGAWLMMAIVWSHAMATLNIADGFPQRQLGNGDGQAIVLQSLLISTVYILSTWLIFQFTRRLPAIKFVQYLSRNTIIIFIVHIPIIFNFYPTYYRWLNGTPMEAWKQESLIVLIYLVCLLISEVITRVVNLERWQMPLWKAISPFLIKIGLTKQAN